MKHLYILPQSSGDFDPEAYPGLKTSGSIRIFDPEEFLGTSYIDPDKNHIANLYHEISRNDRESPALDPERNFNDAGQIFWSSG